MEAGMTIELGKVYLEQRMFCTAREKREIFSLLLSGFTKRLNGSGDLDICEVDFPLEITEGLSEVRNRLDEIFSRIGKSINLDENFKLNDLAKELKTFEKGAILIAGPDDLTYINCRLQRVIDN